MAIPPAEPYRHPNWVEALRILRVFCPDARGFLPDDLPCLSASVAIDLDLSRPDREIATDLWTRVAKPRTGLVVVVTFASFSPHVGPFFAQADALDRLIDQHADSVGDTFFSGDVLFVREAERILTVVHHSELILEFVAQ